MKNYAYYLIRCLCHCHLCTLFVQSPAEFVKVLVGLFVVTLASISHLLSMQKKGKESKKVERISGFTLFQQRATYSTYMVRHEKCNNSFQYTWIYWYPNSFHHYASYESIWMLALIYYSLICKINQNWHSYAFKTFMIHIWYKRSYLEKKKSTFNDAPCIYNTFFSLPLSALDMNVSSGMWTWRNYGLVTWNFFLGKILFFHSLFWPSIELTKVYNSVLLQVQYLV